MWIFAFRALEALLQNGGDPFLKNKNGDSIESYLQNREDLQNLRELVDQARVSKNSEDKGENKFIHKAVENGNMQWLQFYAFFGGNFKSFNKQGERPLDIAIKMANVDIVLYVISQSQELLENHDIFDQVSNFLQSQILEQKISNTLKQKYETLLQKLVKIGTNNDNNVDILFKFIEPQSLVIPNDEGNFDLTVTTQL
jgi:hypothetical protein